jgi:hypothetical protein
MEYKTYYPSISLNDAKIKKLIAPFSCAHCGEVSKLSGYTIINHEITYLSYDGEWYAGTPFITLKCDRCKSNSLAFFSVSGGSHNGPHLMSQRAVLDAEDNNPNVLDVDYEEDTGCSYITNIDFLGIFPSASSSLPKDTPQEIRKNFKEAKNCLAINATTAAVIMSRRVLELIYLKLDPNPKNQNLNKKLNRLLNANIIDQPTFEAFDEIREWGNIGAHETHKSVSYEQAQMVVGMIGEFICRIFVETEKDKIEIWKQILKDARLPGAGLQTP